MRSIEVHPASLRESAGSLRAASAELAAAAADVQPADTGHDLLDDAVRTLAESLHRGCRGLSQQVDVAAVAVRLAAGDYLRTERAVVR